MDRKIIVAGHISYDITPQIYDTKGKNFGKLLKPGKLINVGRATVANGGAVNNTGMALHKFGANVDLIAKVGDDEFGRQIIEKCEDKGAKTNFIKAVGEDTSYTIVLSPPGFDRSFLHFPGTNDTFKFSDLNMEKIKNAYFFHFGYPTLMAGFYENNAKDLIEMYKSIKETGLITSLDVAAIDPEGDAGKLDWKEILKQVLPYVDVFEPSFEELLCMTDEEAYEDLLERAGEEDVCMCLSLEKDVLPLAKRIMEFGVSILLIKCGVAGMYLCTADDVSKKLGLGREWDSFKYFQKSFKPDRIKSAIGAGDTAIAAFIYGIVNEYSPKSTIEIAAGTGAMCITEYDTYSGLIDIKELEEKIKNNWETQDFIKE